MLRVLSVAVDVLWLAFCGVGLVTLVWRFVACDLRVVICVFLCFVLRGLCVVACSLWFVVNNSYFVARVWRIVFCGLCFVVCVV